MGTCLSKRKRMSDAAVTHNASPRTSFSLASKETAHAKVSVISKDSERKSGEEATGRSALAKKSKSKKASQQESNNNANDQKRSSSASSLPSSGTSEVNSSHNSPVVINRAANSQVKAADSTAKGDAEASCKRMEPRSPSLLSSLSPPSSPHPKAIAGAVSDPLPDASRPADDGINLPVSRTSKKRVLFQSHSENSQACGYIQQEHKVKKAEEQEEEEEDEEEGRPPPASKLKRSRSCEHSMRLDVKRPLRRITFQEDVAEALSEVHLRHQKSNKSNSTALLQSSNSKSSSHGESRCSKFLEGLDLIDILPSKPVAHNLLEQLSDSHEEEFLLHDNHQPEDPGRISADFFELKQRYLSSRSATCSAAASSQKDDHRSDKDLDHAGDGTVSFLNTHSRASSVDSVEPELYSSHRHPLFTAVAEEEGCESDDSETFEFNQAVSVFSREGELRRQERLNTQSIAEEGEEDDDDEDDDDDDEDERQEDVDKYQVVATGDAVLVSGTNSEEFHLIPSRAYFESNRNQHHHHQHDHKLEKQQKKGSPLGRVSPPLRMRSGSSSPPVPPSSYLSVDEIICLLERDELDEEVLLSLLRCSGGGPGDGGGGGGTVCISGGTPTSEVASEASFEFKAGSTPPHSTPSTPMLSAGSTPTRQQGPASYINQLSPIALTAEEIAEIWGVFEQRQAISLA